MSGVDSLVAAAIDGTADNVRFRQRQLQALHAILQAESNTIITAIINDAREKDGTSEAEAHAEYFLAMNNVRDLYQSLDFKKSIKDEHEIAVNHDNLNRRLGKGLVILRPTSHTRFYSIICPLATSIAAGNCTGIEVGQTSK